MNLIVTPLLHGRENNLCTKSHINMRMRSLRSRTDLKPYSKIISVKALSSQNRYSLLKIIGSPKPSTRS
nr:hypothetical protein [Cressdnaviricota sp.]